MKKRSCHFPQYNFDSWIFGLERVSYNLDGVAASSAPHEKHQPSLSQSLSAPLLPLFPCAVAVEDVKFAFNCWNLLRLCRYYNLPQPRVLSGLSNTTPSMAAELRGNNLFYPHCRVGVGTLAAAATFHTSSVFGIGNRRMSTHSGSGITESDGGSEGHVIQLPTIALTPEPSNAMSLYDVDWKSLLSSPSSLSSSSPSFSPQPSSRFFLPPLLVLGMENGLSSSVLSQCQHSVYLPQFGSVGSLSMLSALIVVVHCIAAQYYSWHASVSALDGLEDAEEVKRRKDALNWRYRSADRILTQSVTDKDNTTTATHTAHTSSNTSSVMLNTAAIRREVTSSLLVNEDPSLRTDHQQTSLPHCNLFLQSTNATVRRALRLARLGPYDVDDVRMTSPLVSRDDRHTTHGAWGDLSSTNLFSTAQPKEEALMKNKMNRNCLMKFPIQLGLLFNNEICDRNIGACVRNANVYNCDRVFVIQRNKYNRRGALGTQYYTPVHFYKEFEDALVPVEVLNRQRRRTYFIEPYTADVLRRQQQFYSAYENMKEEGEKNDLQDEILQQLPGQYHRSSPLVEGDEREPPSAMTSLQPPVTLWDLWHLVPDYVYLRDRVALPVLPSPAEESIRRGLGHLPPPPPPIDPYHPLKSPNQPQPLLNLLEFSLDSVRSSMAAQTVHCARFLSAGLPIRLGILLLVPEEGHTVDSDILARCSTNLLVQQRKEAAPTHRGLPAALSTVVALERLKFAADTLTASDLNKVEE